MQVHNGYSFLRRIDYGISRKLPDLRGVYDITVVENDETIAMGRLIGDGLYYLIVDIVVKPEFQGKGIGSKIIDMLLAYVDDSTPVGGRSSVQLISERGKEAFYLKKGFKCIPHEFCGSGMRKIINK